jgi:hypothetical protein
MDKSLHGGTVVTGSCMPLTPASSHRWGCLSSQGRVLNRYALSQAYHKAPWLIMILMICLHSDFSMFVHIVSDRENLVLTRAVVALRRMQVGGR